MCSIPCGRGLLSKPDSCWRGSMSVEAAVHFLSRFCGSTPDFFRRFQNHRPTRADMPCEPSTAMSTSHDTSWHVKKCGWHAEIWTACRALFFLLRHMRRETDPIEPGHVSIESTIFAFPFTRPADMCGVSLSVIPI